MNYLAHAYRFLDDPYFVAGTALPDWMSLIDRKNRARRQMAVPIVEHGDARWAAVAKGCIQHHDDDRWFHQHPAFVTLSTTFAVELRELLAAGLGHQAGFVGHISVELLLDSTIAERDPRIVSRYYQTLDQLDHAQVQQAANALCKQPVDKLTELLPRFIESRFLASYLQDESLLKSLNGVMRRIQLPPLPASVAAWLATARPRVREFADDLLAQPPKQPA